MNLDENPTKQQLRELIATCDDWAGSHVLWVTDQGGVQITTVPYGTPLRDFIRAHPEMRMHYVAFEPGNEYTGPEAAERDEWIDELFENLVTEWGKSRGQPGVRRAELVL